jgi:tRNA 2-selenouridine synthase SelU
MFEACLGQRLVQLAEFEGAGRQPMVFESESPRIGNCFVPPAIVQKMATAKHVWLVCSAETRVRRLLEEYRIDISDPSAMALLSQSMDTIGGRMAPTLSSRLREHLENANLHAFVHGLLEYYDQRYRKTAWGSDGSVRVVSTESLEAAAAEVCEVIDSMKT